MREIGEACACIHAKEVGPGTARAEDEPLSIGRPIRIPASASGRELSEGVALDVEEPHVDAVLFSDGDGKTFAVG